MTGELPFWVLGLLVVIACFAIVIITMLLRAMAYKKTFLRKAEGTTNKPKHILAYADQERFGVGRKFVLSVLSTVFSPSDYEKLFDEANGVDFKKMRESSIRESYVRYRKAYRLAGLIFCLFAIFMILIVIIGNSIFGMG